MIRKRLVASDGSEVAQLLQQGRLGLAGVEFTAHVVGSVLLTILGMATVIFARCYS
jgi:fluoride ion exporter CrcB/FEX